MRIQDAGHGHLLTTVVDLFLIVIIAFLGMGTLVGHLVPESVATPSPPVSVKPQAAELAPPKKKTPDPEEVQQSVKEGEKKVRSMTGLIATLTAEIDRLRKQLAVAAARETQLKELAEDLAGRNTALAGLEKEKEKYAKQLAEIQANRAREQDAAYTFTPGAPLVNRHKKARSTTDVMLHKGKVMPILAPFYTGAKQADGTLVMWPDKPGLSIEAALQNDSALMKKVLTPDFRKDGRVRIFVNADSFAAFRALRDHLVQAGVDYGWEPVEGTRLAFSSHGIAIPSQTP